MRFFFTFILFLFCITFPFQGYATHMFGSDFEWSHISGDTFLIKLTIYRDCNGVQLSNASIPIKCATTGYPITTLSITKPAPQDITPTCKASCSRCQTSSCSFPYGIEKYVFLKQVVLSSSISSNCCKINMSYTMCCRNSSITSGAANANFFIDAQFDRCLSTPDNSPVFTNPPIDVFCISNDYFFSCGTIDLDKDSSGNLLDSISYEWTPPLSNAGSAISYPGQYSYDKPVFFWGMPNANLPWPRGFHLDQNTGEISFRPMKVEQTVAAIKVKEWRRINGVMQLIGSTRRDMQWVVISCPNNHPPVINGPFYKEVHAGDTVLFSIATNDYDVNDTVRINWNEAIPGASWTANNDSVKHPTGQLLWIPNSNDVSSIPYQFMAFVNDDACPVNGRSSRTFQVLVCQNSGDISISNTGCGTYIFDVINSNPAITDYFWIIASSPPIYYNGKTFSKRFPKSGTYPVQFSLLTGCGFIDRYDTLTITDSFIYTKLSPDTLICKPDSVWISASVHNVKGNLQFLWSNGDSTRLSQQIYVTSDTVFYFSATDSSGCTDYDSVQIILDDIALNMSPDVLKCPADTATIAAYFYP
ncbi:hypothetical protein ACFLRI_05465, partial [Bacteroidota bacterium]